MDHTIKTEKAPNPVGNYPHARKVGNLLFLSGVGPRKPGTNVIPGVMMDGQGNALGHDIEVQCHSVFENVKICWSIGVSMCSKNKSNKENFGKNKIFN